MFANKNSTTRYALVTPSAPSFSAWLGEATTWSRRKLASSHYTEYTQASRRCLVCSRFWCVVEGGCSDYVLISFLRCWPCLSTVDCK